MAIAKFFNIQHTIFGICPECNEFFRLGDCKIFSKKKPVPDWKDKIVKENQRLDSIQEKIDEMEQELREKGREKGRLEAQKTVRKIDSIFTPRKLNPDDAKVIFHPIDYIVFNGMKAKSIQNLILLDRKTQVKSHKKIQKSIERTIDHEKYCWQTIRVCNDGKICVE